MAKATPDAGRHRGLAPDALHPQRDEDGRPGRRGGEIDLPPQDQRQLVADHVAQDAARRRGDDAEQHRRPGVGAGQQRDLRAQHGVERHAHGIGPEQRAEAAFQPVRDEEDQHRDGGADRQQLRRAQPEDRRAPQQQVAQRAAAEAGDGGDQHEADHVHLLAARPPARRRRRRPRCPPKSRQPQQRVERAPSRYSAATATAPRAGAAPRPCAPPAQSSDRPQEPRHHRQHQSR